jgi:hypothetical protein
MATRDFEPIKKVVQDAYRDAKAVPQVPIQFEG